MLHFILTVSAPVYMILFFNSSIAATPPAPSDLVVHERFCTAIALGWEEVSMDGHSALIHELQSTTNDCSEWKIVSTMASGINYCKVSGLEIATRYKFKIRSKYEAGWSDFATWGNEISTCGKCFFQTL